MNITNVLVRVLMQQIHIHNKALKTPHSGIQFKSFRTWALRAYPGVIKRHKRNEIWHYSSLFFSWNTHLRTGKGLERGHYCLGKSPQICECSCGVWRWVASGFSQDSLAIASPNPFQCSSGLHWTVACCLRRTEHNIGGNVWETKPVIRTEHSFIRNTFNHPDHCY